MTQLQASELLENLSEVLKGLQRGEQYVLCEGDTPIATLLPYVKSKSADEPQGDTDQSADEEETDDEDFARELEAGIEENMELLRRLAQ